MKKVLFVLAIAVAISFSSNAQKIKVLEGDLSFLKGQTEIQSKFDYSEMAVGKYKKE